MKQRALERSGTLTNFQQDEEKEVRPQGQYQKSNEGYKTDPADVGRVIGDGATTLYTCI